MPANEIAEERNRRCRYCGGLIVPRVEECELPWRHTTRKVVLWPRHHGCEQERDFLAHQKRARELQEWQAKLYRAGLVGKLADATFDSFTENEGWPGALEVKQQVMDFTRAMLAGELDIRTWLIMHGNYGTGKSHLAAAVVRHALAAGWQRCYFRVWPDYLRRFNAAWDRSRRGILEGETEDDIVRELQFGDLVVIDDLDKRKPTDWVLSILYSILNNRWNEEKPTILTFNYGPDDVDPKAPGRLWLERYLGRPVIDRLIDSAYATIEFNGKSYRSGLSWSVTDDDGES